ncbi:hypothetical protein [Sphingobium sp.]|uniref:hypothetical protein n=1 Tax=Sphingobium sp. TaxID=1912891 RepID=UPI003B3B0F58
MIMLETGLDHSDGGWNRRRRSMAETARFVTGRAALGQCHKSEKQTSFERHRNDIAVCRIRIGGQE